MEHYRKKKIWLQGFLQGRGMTNALIALEFAERYHTGVRKDKITPEMEHQISQACYAVTILPLLRHPEETICVILLHDTAEDYYQLGVTFEMIQELFPKGPKELIDSGVKHMTKEYQGVKLSSDVYYGNMSNCPIASMAKPIDRFHNHGSMNNSKEDGTPVFTFEKQKLYMTETKDYILPMVKRSRKLYPDQHMAYLNITTILKDQINMLEAVQRAAT